MARPRRRRARGLARGQRSRCCRRAMARACRTRCSKRPLAAARSSPPTCPAAARSPAGRDRAPGAAGRRRGAGRGDRRARRRPGAAPGDSAAPAAPWSSASSPRRSSRTQTLALYRAAAGRQADAADDPVVACDRRAGRRSPRWSAGAVAAHLAADPQRRNCCAPARSTAWSMPPRWSRSSRWRRAASRGAAPAAVAGWSFARRHRAVQLAACSRSRSTRRAWLGWVTPFGGVAFMVGWAGLAILAFRRR